MRITTHMRRARTRTIDLLAGLSLLAAASLTGFAAPASASHPLDILIVAADSPPTHFPNDLRAESGVAAVDVVDGRTTTPTAEQLKAYDAVVTWSNSSYANSTALGNSLADYYDACGVVMEFLFDDVAGLQPTGRWESGGYPAVTDATSTSSATTSLGTHDATHPLMQGVSNLTTNYTSNPGLNTGASSVAQWANQELAVAYKGRATFVNAYVGSHPSGWSGDFSQIVVNAANWRGGECQPQQQRGPTAAAAADAAPVVTAASAENSVFRVDLGAQAAAPGSTPRGTAFAFRLSEAATVAITIQKSLRRGLRDLRTFTRQGAAGQNRVPFSGRILVNGRPRALRPGSYQASVVATDAAGNRSGAQVIPFRVVGCLPRRLAVSGRRVGPARLGGSYAALDRLYVATRRSRRYTSFCADGGGRFVVGRRKGRIDFVGTTARTHRTRGHGPGRGVRSGRIRGARRVGRGLLVGHRQGGGRVVYGVRGGRVRFLAVVPRGETRRARTLLRRLRAAGLR
jgi:hypothetical protein